MKRDVTLKSWLLGAAILSTAALCAQAQTNQPPLPPGVNNVPNGLPVGVAKLAGQNTSGFPTPRMVDGQPIETRPPELPGDHALMPGQTRAPYHASVPYQVTTITDGLKLPWSFQFLPDGKMLTTERTAGTMVIVSPDGAISKPLSGVPAVVAAIQVGLLDVALDAHFAANHRIFFSYSEAVTVPGSPTAHSNIVIARATLDEKANALNDVKVIFRAKPALPQTVQPNQGGKITVAPDGNIFMTVGDRSGSPPWDYAQRLDSDLGKIIHITPDGAPAKNNPYLDQAGALPEIWSIGHRSEEGLAIEPGTGHLWEVEDGPRGGDEVNLIEPGKNYGWPLTTHALDYPGEMINNGALEAPGTVQPVYFWDPVIAPSGLTFYTGKLFPAWQHSLFVGALRGSMLDRLEMKNNKVVAEEPLLVDQKSRIRDVRVGPDGAIYVITDGGKLMKITPK